MKIQQSLGVHSIGKLIWFAILAAAMAACSLMPAAPPRPSVTASQEQSMVSAQPTQTAAVQDIALQQPVAAPEEGIQATTIIPIPVSSSFAPVDWGEAPPCVNQPLTTREWRSLFATRPSEAGAALFMLNQAQDALAENAPVKSELAALEFNIASGRLNRETGIEVAGLPDMHTIGNLLDKLEPGLTGQEVPPEVIQASQQVLSRNGITRAVCARMLVTQANNEPAEVMWSSTGIQEVAPPAALAALPGEAESGLVKDSGLVSPDGKKAAFTSRQMDSGGPIFLLDLQSGAWTNLIRAVNERLQGSQSVLAEDLWWEIAGWLPDSQRLMLTPADLSSVYMVDLSDYSFQSYGFDGGGLGGGSAVQLAPDGSRFVYFGLDSSGGQSFNSVDLATGQVSQLGILAPEQGFMHYPRFSPDGSMLAYQVQMGHPLTGLTYSINLYSFANGSERILVQGNLGPSVPTWSPDGQRIAFTKKEPDEPDLVVPDQAPAPVRGNIWVVSVGDGALTRLTFIDGWARSPAWVFDARTLAFVTHDGQVGMVSLDQPGKTWLAVGTPSENPLVTSAIFVP